MIDSFSLKVISPLQNPKRLAEKFIVTWLSPLDFRVYQDCLSILTTYLLSLPERPLFERADLQTAHSMIRYGTKADTGDILKANMVNWSSAGELVERKANQRSTILLLRYWWLLFITSNSVIDVKTCSSKKKRKEILLEMKCLEMPLNKSKFVILILCSSPFSIQWIQNRTNHVDI